MSRVRSLVVAVGLVVMPRSSGAAMSGPLLARLDPEGDRFYTFGDPPERYYSVTTIIGGGVPKYLHAHYAKMSSELAYDSMVGRGPTARSRSVAKAWTTLGRKWVQERQANGELTSIRLDRQSDRDLALRWLKGAAERHRDEAAVRGIAVHDEAEALVLEQAHEAGRLIIAGAELTPWPAGLEGYQHAFTSWLTDFQPRFEATEATVFNRQQAYAGTLDCLAWVRLDPDRPEEMLLIVDYKSGRAIYPDVALQLSAYARSEFIGLPDGVTALPMPQPQAGAVLHLTAKGQYKFRLVRIDEPVYDAFRFAREVYRWVKETASTALLQELTPLPPTPEEIL